MIYPYIVWFLYLPTSPLTYGVWKRINVRDITSFSCSHVALNIATWCIAIGNES